MIVILPGGLYLQNQKIGVCNHKTKRLSGITFTVRQDKASNPDLRKCQFHPPPLCSDWMSTSAKVQDVFMSV